METKETNEFTFTPTGEENQLWVLSKDSGNTYRVDLKDFVCSCEDFKFRRVKGDRLCKHLKAAAEVYEVEPPKEEKLPAVAEGQAITISQEEIMQELSTELKEEFIRGYVYKAPDYYRKVKSKTGREHTTKKPGWIDLTATGIQDLAHMVADRYGNIEVGEFRFMEAGDKWIAWRDIKLGNFTATGFADCPKDREFPFRYLGKVVMRNAYKAIVPKVYQNIFTNKFREWMRQQLLELIGPEGEKKLGKPIAELADGELTYTLEQAQKGKLQLAPPKPKLEAEEDEEISKPKRTRLHFAGVQEVKPDEAWEEIAKEAEVVKTEVGARAPKPKRDPETIKDVNQLLKACHDDFKLQPKQVYAELNASGPMEITDPADAYRRIAVVRG
ncbi:MAG: SWIM zinc finger family protein [Deltaproteobacteria bacterium]|nr:SWIM zinc finger family protein [Deltaproteobacteria bacterium]